MGDVIDFHSRKKIKSESNPDKNAQSQSASSEVPNIGKIRLELIDQERRDKRRTIVNGFLGAHVLIPGQGLLKVSIFDVSEEGMSFDIDPEWGSFKEKEEVALRFYFNHQTYFPFEVKITSSRLIAEEGIIRHGSSIIPDADRNETFFYFAYFLNSASKYIKIDSGDLVLPDRKV